LKNVELNESAVFDRDDYINIGIGPHPLGKSQTSVLCNGSQIRVKCETLITIFEQRGIEPGAFLKIDVEGAEYCLFDDLEFFRRYKPIIYCELHFNCMDFEKSAHLQNALKNFAELYHFPFPSPTIREGWNLFMVPKDEK